MVAISLEKQSLLTQAFVLSVLDYDPKTGLLTWRVDRNRTAKVGQVAGSVHSKHGHVVLTLCGWEYQAHRLIWFMVKGEWPVGQVDHEDEDKINNRWSNLREATHGQNQANVRSPQRNNRSGVRGVCWHKGTGRWVVQIGYGGKGHCVGYFSDLAEATAARRAAELKYFGEFAPA